MLTKAKSLIPKTAKELDLPESLVKDVVDHYYSALRKNMSSLEHSRIRVPELGVFYVSKKKLEISIIKLKAILLNEQDPSFKKLTRIKSFETSLEKQLKLLDKINETENEQQVIKRMEK
jgi:hypothetical protein